MTPRRRRVWMLALVACASLALALGGVGAQEATSLSLATSSTTDSGNHTATVTVELTNTGGQRSVAPAVRVADVPENWTVVSQSSPNGTWRGPSREWLWLRVDPGETVTASVTLAYPANASGVYRLPVEARDAQNATADANATVAVGGATPPSTPSTPAAPGPGDGGGNGVVLLAGAAALVAGGYLYLSRDSEPTDEDAAEEAGAESPPGGARTRSGGHDPSHGTGRDGPEQAMEDGDDSGGGPG